LEEKLFGHSIGAYVKLPPVVAAILEYF